MEEEQRYLQGQVNKEYQIAAIWMLSHRIRPTHWSDL